MPHKVNRLTLPTHLSGMRFKGDLERPLVYFWIVQYKSGLAVSQFTPDGTEVYFGDIPKGDIVKIGWYPFSVRMFHILTKKGKLVIPTNNPIYELSVVDGYFKIYRRNKVKYGKSGVARLPTVYVLENSKKRLEITEQGTVSEVEIGEVR